MSVLLINASYEPLRIISMKRAIDLVLQRKATVIEESGHRIRSALLDMAAPSVIKLNYFVKIPYKSRVPLNRRTLMARDNSECQYIVNGQSCSKVGNTIDHVKPRAKGGLHEWTNTVACCSKHNQRKRDLELTEKDLPGWSLKRLPQTPSGAAWVVLGIAAAAGESQWNKYLAFS